MKHKFPVVSLSVFTIVASVIGYNKLHGQVGHYIPVGQHPAYTMTIHKIITNTRDSSVPKTEYDTTISYKSNGDSATVVHGDRPGAFVDFRSRANVVMLVPSLNAKMTFALPNQRLRQHKSDCSDILIDTINDAPAAAERVEENTVLGLPVVIYKMHDSIISLSPRLNCALVEQQITTGDHLYETKLINIAFTSDESMFAVPAAYKEMSPKAAAAIHEATTGLTSPDCEQKFVTSLEKKYQEHLPIHP